MLVSRGTIVAGQTELQQWPDLRKWITDLRNWTNWQYIEVPNTGHEIEASRYQDAIKKTIKTIAWPVQLGATHKVYLCYNMLMKAANVTAYPAVFNPIPDGGYEVSFPDFPGCVTFGNTFEEAHEKASEVLSLWIEELEAEHAIVPKHTERPIITDVKVALA